MENNINPKQNTEAISPDIILENSFLDYFRNNLDLDLTQIILFFLAGINVIFVILIIASLFLSTSIEGLLTTVNNINTLQAIKVSILSILISIMITVLVGVPFSYVVSQNGSKINKVVNMFIKLPLVMPPTVAGLALLLTFGNRGILSDIINTMNLNLPFTFTALIIVQVFVMLPLFTQSLKSGFEAIDEEVKEAAMVFGAEEKDILFKIYLPLSIKPLLTGIIMACLRAAGEFGATMMFAGNLSGKTQTLSTAIYIMAQKDLSQSIALAVVLIITFSLPLIILELKLK
ncbi:molybdate transport system permease protein [Halanaerobium saccharolyticum]|uniref:Molybdate transport system permease protein n=1 Tax=Halanaerobium saccharolyticum TaxID=43595 RepID=A0A4R7Z8R3_9FIRM|nr:ABC transporter permease subunit [Halanaerobium saccharolyticum]RAK11796.1 molybdate transport system permease protein [Halanaerobium saccharolyticum]TDW07637.1 molybdate transport system permease protein [Halanaerobium saccharolyticum]TDX64558.1 molybdate transport system permease protein [Halanaerobium saccharolyticum]